MSRGKKCLIRGCTKDAKTRGVCQPHYMRARRRVEAGEITFDELVADGKLLPKRQSDDPMDKAIRKLKAKKSA